MTAPIGAERFEMKTRKERRIDQVRGEIASLPVGTKISAGDAPPHWYSQVHVTFGSGTLFWWTDEITDFVLSPRAVKLLGR